MHTKTILIVTRHTPLPWEDGAGAYLHGIARHLATSGFTVTILWLAPHDHLRWQKIWRLPAAFSTAVRLRLPGAICLGERRFFFPAVIWQPFRARVLGLARRALAAVGINPPRKHPLLTVNKVSVPHRWASPPTDEEAACVETFAAHQRPDVVIANYAWMCPVLDLPALRAARHVCLTHDIGWKRAALSTSGAPTEVSREEESGWLRRADIVLAISEADENALRDLAPYAKVILAPKAVDASTPLPASACESHRLLFVGSDNAFNADGLTWFLHEVWPSVIQAFPSASLDVCGSIDRLVTERPDGVAFHGMIPSLDSHYASAALVVIPLLRSTGLNIKLVEAASVGRAVVATSVCLSGAPFLRDAVLVADSAVGFSAEVCRLLGAPLVREALAARALAAVREHLAADTCYGPLLSELRH